MNASSVITEAFIFIFIIINLHLRKIITAHDRCLVEIDEASERNCGTEEDDPASKKSVMEPFLSTKGGQSNKLCGQRFHQTPPRVHT
ncbi:hypothetical protein NC653_040303 [Populus alba x Populus x berolinensis]|uniref:Uncharacterized protein n=1 Tax=Populus alba x Populus x berolinensis TaxID=444605 RepID=A0AAD6LDD0_9ROSI|nr:hypothetical protein NC653_040303 [Populus alba x Populus x berolinensis]